MQLQKEGLIDGVARRALQLPLFMGTGPMEQDLQEQDRAFAAIWYGLASKSCCWGCAMQVLTLCSVKELETGHFIHGYVRGFDTDF